MWAPGKLELLENEMERYRFDILGLAEMRWTASGEMHGCKVIWSGNEQKILVFSHCFLLDIKQIFFCLAIMFAFSCTKSVLCPTRNSD